MSRRNWARGAPPPAHSWEYAGMPRSAAEMMAGEKTKEEARVNPKENTSGKKNSPWPFAVGGFVLGLVLGSWGND